MTIFDESGESILYKILLVDPNSDSSETMLHMLDWNQAGFCIHTTADNITDALYHVDNPAHILVLINIKRLQSFGLQLCGLIRQKSRIPIILIGGGQDFNLARQALHYQVNDYLTDPVQSSELLDCLGRFRRNLDASLDDAVKAPQPHCQNSIIDMVKKYVQEELHQNISLKKISEALHFNCAYLGQKFKSEEQISFNEYLLQQRMEKAKHLLESTEMRIYEISREVGYSETDWFYKKFKEYTGTSANEYRKQTLITA